MGGVNLRFRWVANIEKSKPSQRYIRTWDDECVLVEDAANQAHLSSLGTADVAIGGVLCGALSSLNPARAANGS